MRPPAQVLSELFDALAVLMAEANPADQDVHNAEIAKVKEQITQAKADLVAEDTRMATKRAALDAQAYRLMLDQSASQEVMRRKHRSRLPLVFEARDLFNTPGARTGNRWRETGWKLLGPVHRFSLVRWTRLVKTPLYLRLF